MFNRDSTHKSLESSVTGWYQHDQWTREILSNLEREIRNFEHIAPAEGRGKRRRGVGNSGKKGEVKLEDGRAENDGSGRGESCERSSMTCRRSEGY